MIIIIFQEKESIQKRLVKTESKDDTNQMVVEELKTQQAIEANRLAKVNYFKKLNLALCTGERKSIILIKHGAAA